MSRKCLAQAIFPRSNQLLDQTNCRKSVDQVLSLLAVLDCDVDLLVHTKTA